jgi:competence protein ComEC
MGAFLVLLFVLLKPADLAIGCHDVVVKSRARSFGSQILYKVESIGGVALIRSDEGHKYNDHLKVCIKESDILNQQNKYLLSQYKTEYVINNPSVELISPGNGLIRQIYDFSDLLSAATYHLYSGDEAVLARGLILGGSSDFSDKMKVNLKRSGTSHIVAVSGYNVSILTIIIFDLLRKAISKKAAGIITPIFLIVFYFLTGGSASVLRASIMGLIVLASRFVGRRVSAVHLLILSLSIMLVLNPYSIYDVGFQLSFAAIAGIFFLSENLNLLFERFIKTKNVLVKIFAETIAAQIYTLPILLTTFGLFSIIAPVANVLILPLVPGSMLLVFLSLMAGMLNGNFGILVSSISAIFLKFFLLVINSLGSLSFASVLIKLPFIVAIGLYCAIIYLTIILGKFIKNEKQIN